MSRPKAGDRVEVIATGETGTLISTKTYNAISKGQLKPTHWRWTRWVRFDKLHNGRCDVVGHCPSELRVLPPLDLPRKPGTCTTVAA